MEELFNERQSDYDWEEIKEKVIIKPVSKTLNPDVVKKAPVTLEGDIGASYLVVWRILDEGMVTSLITNEMREHLGVTVKELHETAVKNMVSAFPMTEVSLKKDLDVLMSGNLKVEKKKGPADPYEMIAITNPQKMFGAASVFYPEVKKRMETLYPGGCYILPSSIHEVLLVAKNEISLSELEQMVASVNDTEVRADERLSYKVHEYDPKTRGIYLGGQAPEMPMQAEKTKQRAV